MRRERTKAAERRRRSYEDKRAYNEVRSKATNSTRVSCAVTIGAAAERNPRK